MSATKKPLLILLLAGFLTGCIEDETRCKRPIEITSSGHLVDISPLLAIPELKARLERFPQLQVYEVDDNEYYIGFWSHYFYKGLMVFDERYHVSKGRKHHNQLNTFGTLPDTIAINTTPTLPVKQAIEIAKRRVEFKRNCIAYRLGIWDINQTGTGPKEYRLVWHLEGGEDTRPDVEVKIDAHTGEIYRLIAGGRFWN